MADRLLHAGQGEPLTVQTLHQDSPQKRPGANPETRLSTDHTLSCRNSSSLLRRPEGRENPVKSGAGRREVTVKV